ncbi:MAG TPA: hypothetical protein VFX58_04105 [Chitinophagaceae bacterium]|nr:hypothetical protein [Chitinophagaceae bacterium]
MKTISINIITRIREWLPFYEQKKNSSSLVHKTKPAVNQTINESLNDERKMDMSMMQRKAWQGHFMAGPYALLHPGLFK